MGLKNAVFFFAHPPRHKHLRFMGMEFTVVVVVVVVQFLGRIKGTRCQVVPLQIYDHINHIYIFLRFPQLRFQIALRLYRLWMIMVVSYTPCVPISTQVYISI